MNEVGQYLALLRDDTWAIILTVLASVTGTIWLVSTFRERESIWAARDWQGKTALVSVAGLVATKLLLLWPMLAGTSKDTLWRIVGSLSVTLFLLSAGLISLSARTDWTRPEVYAALTLGLFVLLLVFVPRYTQLLQSMVLLP